MARRVAAVLAPAAAWIAWCAAVAELPRASHPVGTAVVALVTLPLGVVVVAALVPRALADVRLTLGFLAGGAILAVGGSLLGWTPAEGIGKLLLGGCLGVLAIRLLEEAWHALLVAVLVIGVDTYSVFWGPTSRIAEGSPGVLDALTIPLPEPGRPHAALLGITDIVFFALFAACALRWRLRPALTVPLCALSFSVTVVVSAALDHALPALPLLALALLLPNWRALRPGHLSARQPPAPPRRRQ